MTVADVVNLNNEKVSEIELIDTVFAVPVKKHVLHEVVISQLASRRAGTSSSKTRSEVKASGSKLYKQKGTGRARAGTAGSPTRKGGGSAFGPSPRKYSIKVSKKVKKAALRMALSDKINNCQLTVVENFNLPEIKTKKFKEIMNCFNVRKALIVTDDKSINLEKSSKNVPNIKVMRREGLNVYDILKYDILFLEKASIEKIQEALLA